MAKPHERVISFIIAILFFVIASATAVFVIYDATHKSDTTSTTTSDAAKAANQQDSFCSQTDTSGTTGVEKLAAPEVYKTDKVESLQTKDLVAGSGDTAANGDCLYMKYYGTLASDGTLFDENFTKDTAFKFQLGASQVIKGWDQGLEGMKVGGTRQLIIPSNLGYGDQANGKIPANANLVFVVKLLKVQKKQ